MKKSLVVLALLACFGAHAQDVSSNSGSNSNSGANSGSTSGVSSSNSGNTTAIGNQNSSGSQSGSQSGAQSGSMSGAMGNNVTLNQNVPSTQNINQSGTSTSTSNSTNTNMMGGGTNNTDNVKYSGTITNAVSGGTYSTMNENVHYSGTQTIKNVPGIAMSGPASGPCTGNSGGIGVAGPGFGVGLNGAKVDDGCTVRENTRILGQMMQSLDSADPLKAQAKAALAKSMAILDAMNDKIGSGYLPPPPPPPQAKAEVVQPTSTAVSAAPGEPSDPYVRSRMGLPQLASNTK